MSDFFDLEKEAEFILTKRDIRNVRARVGNALDVSGSTRTLYANGTMQRYLNRGLALATKLDDDGNLDTWVFDTDVRALASVSKADFDGYVRRSIMSLDGIWRGTAYQPALAAAHQHWFGAPQAEEQGGFFSRLFGGGSKPKPATRDTSPALLLFWTDGENDHESPGAVERFMESIKGDPMYLAFIGVGDQSFRFIRNMADVYPNVGFMHIPGNRIDTIPDDELYAELVSEEMAQWLRAADAEFKKGT